LYADVPDLIPGDKAYFDDATLTITGGGGGGCRPITIAVNNSQNTIGDDPHPVNLAQIDGCEGYYGSSTVTIGNTIDLNDGSKVNNSNVRFPNTKKSK